MKNPEFTAELVRERFTLIPNKENMSNDDIQVAVGNRLTFSCLDHTGQKQGDFVLRAQNIHTCLRIGAHIARHWYEHGHILDTGRNRFFWHKVYEDSTKDYEQRWNPDCWACLYQNGRVLYETTPPAKSQFLDIIEQVFAYKKCPYEHIITTAEELFQKAGRDVDIEYDKETAINLIGDPQAANATIVYRAVDSKNELKISIENKKSKISSSDGSKIKLSECMSLAAVIFEGMQLGFTVGRNNSLIDPSEPDKVSPTKARQTQHAMQRIKRMNKALEALKAKHDLKLKPNPDFQQYIESVERSLRGGRR